MFSLNDQKWMRCALQEAQLALEAGDYPVGAVLTVNGVLFATARNALFSEGRTTAHAEHTLIATHSAHLRALIRTAPETEICLYTTLEPCLMCLGIAVLHRVPRIVVVCPDPHGGTANLDLTSVGSVYARWWPTIEMGLYQEQSCDLIETFLKTEKLLSWRMMLTEFQQMRMRWVTDGVKASCGAEQQSVA